MKKEVVLLISLISAVSLLISVLPINLVQASSIPGAGDIDPETGVHEDMSRDYEDLKNRTETRWEYLGERWEEILLENEAISSMNSFFEKISIVFRFLFGQPYSLSIALLGIIILWTLIAWEAGGKINASGILKGGTAYLGGIGFAILLAQTQLLRIFIDWLGWLIFVRKEWWWNIAISGGIVIAFFIVHLFSGTIDKILRERREKREKDMEEQNKNFLETLVKSLLNKEK